MAKFIEKMENNFDKYRKNCEALSHHYSNTMSTLSNLSDLFKEMEEDVIDFNKRVLINEVYDLDDSFRMMKTGYDEQYSRLKFEKKILDEKVLPFVRYEKENIHISK